MYRTLLHQYISTKKLSERREIIVIEVDMTYKILAYKYKLTKNSIHSIIFKIPTTPKSFKFKTGQDLEHKSLYIRLTNFVSHFSKNHFLKFC